MAKLFTDTMKELSQMTFRRWPLLLVQCKIETDIRQDMELSELVLVIQV